MKKPKKPFIPCPEDERHDNPKVFQRMRKISKHRINYGIELELKALEEHNLYEVIDAPALFFQLQSRIPNLATVGTDSGGMEIRSVPFCTKKQVFSWLDKLLAKGLYITKTQPSSLGMHIHVSSKPFKKLGNISLIYFLEQHGQKFFTKHFSNRPYSEWANFGCSEGDYEDKIDWLGNYEAERHLELGSAFTLNTYHDTHEFRFFKSTSSPAEAKTNFECVQAITDYIKKHTSEKYLKDIEYFKDFVYNNKKKYPFFYKSMKKKKLI